MNHPIVGGQWSVESQANGSFQPFLCTLDHLHSQKTHMEHEHHDFQTEIVMAIDLMKASEKQNHGVKYCDVSFGNNIELYLSFVEHLRLRFILNLHLYSSISIFLWLKIFEPPQDDLSTFLSAPTSGR